MDAQTSQIVNDLKANLNLSQGWASYQLQVYALRNSGKISFNLENLEEDAKKVLSSGAFWYVAGSAGLGATAKANRAEFAKYTIVPAMLEDKPLRSLETKLFGVTYSSPLILAPIGVQGIIHPDAEEATARAASALKVPFILSTAATRSIETIATAAGDAARWFQLYWPKSDDITISLLKRAQDNGYSTLVVTLDTVLLGWRPEDLQSAYLPFIHGCGCQVGFSDPVFMSRFGAEPSHEKPKFPYDPQEYDAIVRSGGAAALPVMKQLKLSLEWLKEANSGTFRGWKDLELLKKHWNGPIVLKGIQSVKDAERAIDAGVSGIIVSNHGGRQVDGAIASLEALRRICESPKVQAARAADRFTVLFDSGIRSGSDIIKAMSLGAQGVLLGRPYIYGLALGGEDGVKHVIKTVLADLDLMMGNASITTLGAGEHVVKVA